MLVQLVLYISNFSTLFLLLLAILFTIILLLPAIFKTKCPKCKNNCKESYYLLGDNDSFYYKCPVHGNIDKIN